MADAASLDPASLQRLVVLAVLGPLAALMLLFGSVFVVVWLAFAWAAQMPLQLIALIGALCSLALLAIEMTEGIAAQEAENRPRLSYFEDMLGNSGVGSGDRSWLGSGIGRQIDSSLQTILWSVSDVGVRTSLIDIAYVSFWFFSTLLFMARCWMCQSCRSRKRASHNSRNANVLACCDGSMCDDDDDDDAESKGVSYCCGMCECSDSDGLVGTRRQNPFENQPRNVSRGEQSDGRSDGDTDPMTVHEALARFERGDVKANSEGAAAAWTAAAAALVLLLLGVFKLGMIEVGEERKESSSSSSAREQETSSLWPSSERVAVLCICLGFPCLAIVAAAAAMQLWGGAERAMVVRSERELFRTGLWAKGRNDVVATVAVSPIHAKPPGSVMRRTDSTHGLPTQGTTI